MLQRAATQIIVDYDPMAAGDKTLRHVGPDAARAAGDEYLLRHALIQAVYCTPFTFAARSCAGPDSSRVSKARAIMTLHVSKYRLGRMTTMETEIGRAAWRG